MKYFAFLKKIHREIDESFIVILFDQSPNCFTILENCLGVSLPCSNKSQAAFKIFFCIIDYI